MKIYTKTGDAGETGLFGGGRVTKDCITMQVVGELDELNAAIGIAVAVIPTEAEESLDHILIKIQRDLFKVGVEVASGQTEGIRYQVSGCELQVISSKLISEKEIVELEKSIDVLWDELPKLKNFIIPGGHIASAQLHLARAICRRAERALVAFGKTISLRPELYQYLNRLSDWLFTAARWVNFKTGEKENLVLN